MFLLNLTQSIDGYAQTQVFTSHYVPIKSTTQLRYILQNPQPLHPIMFLLNPYTLPSNLKSNNFTSHYVPIKSYNDNTGLGLLNTLHPIMFLLNHAYTQKTMLSL